MGLFLILQILHKSSLHKVNLYMLGAAVRLNSTPQIKDCLKSQVIFAVLLTILTHSKKKKKIIQPLDGAH